MSDDDDGAIKVSVRIRPLNTRELENAQTIGFQYSDKALRETTSSGEKEYRFDHCFGPDTQNTEAYEKVGQTLVQHAMDGYNATIFTYGQTGSGKTHSILGNDSDPGFIPRTIQDVFNHVIAHPDTNYNIMVSYLEVYNEEINDLLQMEEDEGKNLRILTEDPQKGAIIENLIEQVVTCKQDITNVLTEGEKHRSYGSTLMNNTSSRSHTLFRMIIESKTELNVESDEDEEVKDTSGGFQTFGAAAAAGGSSKKISYLNLVDLAGSERQKSTGASGSQLKEGSNINKSLLALGAVISKLGESHKQGRSKKGAFIPFRDSKLTRILKNSLGGNTLTSILCTITAAPMHHDETISTLKFGQLCKTIKNKAKKNETIDEKTLLKQYRAKISDLQHQIAIFSGEVDMDGGESGEGGKLKRTNSMASSGGGFNKLREVMDQAERDKARTAELELRVKKLSDMVIRRNPNANPESTSPTNIQYQKQSSRSRTRSASVFAPAGSILPGAASAFAGAADDMRTSVASTSQGEESSMEKMQLYSDIQVKEKRIEELENDGSYSREEIGRLEEELEMKIQIIEELTEDRTALLETQAEKKEFQDLARKEIQEYHDKRQEELDEQQETVDDKKTNLDDQEETLNKRQKQLEEMQNQLSAKLALLDEKESDLQQKMNKLEKKINLWNHAKEDLQRREDTHISWNKQYKTDEWKQQKDKEKINELKEQVERDKKEVEHERSRLRAERMALEKKGEDLHRTEQKLEKDKVILDEDTLKVTDWKRILKKREIEVEEKERHCDKRESTLEANTSEYKRNLNALKELKNELIGKDEDLSIREHDVEKHLGKIERLQPALQSRERDLDHKAASLEIDRETTDKMAVENKLMAAANEEMKSEFEIRSRGVDKREASLLEKEKLHQDLEDKKIALDQRELRQKLKEEQWVESVARTHATKNADLKQSNDLLMAQIESARVYEQDLRQAKADLAGETKSRRVAMKKVQEVQEKFENLLKEKNDAGGWGQGGETQIHPSHHHSSISSGVGFGFMTDRRPTMAAEGVQRRKRLSTALGTAPSFENKQLQRSRSFGPTLEDIDDDDVSLDLSEDTDEDMHDAKAILAESLLESANVLDDIFSSAVQDIKRTEAIKKFGGDHTNVSNEHHTMHSAIGRSGGALRKKKDKKKALGKGGGLSADSQAKDQKPKPRKRNMSIGKATLYETFSAAPDFKSFPTDGTSPPPDHAGQRHSGLNRQSSTVSHHSFGGHDGHGRLQHQSSTVSRIPLPTYGINSETNSVRGKKDEEGHKVEHTGSAFKRDLQVPKKGKGVAVIELDLSYF
ncbi:hypothetical protein TL16_g03003 [Triparma laevis f. inornata]|uniref:Kinesin motor domain-containing protein n=1 Tax=Triparma laevis f. inornata TaxID=1714386 RepID=A0A9W7DYW6_9STRA|nr:hypothetical protein TL16_g03003 [Triparma laevis f. inornata]